MKRLLKIGIPLLVVALLFSTLVAPSVALAQPPMVQMAICLDGSGSIDAGEWAIMLNGLAAAVGNPAIVPRDGSVELCVIQFSDGLPGDAQVELPPTVVTDATAPGIVATINGINQDGGLTPLAAGIDLCVATIIGSPNFPTATWQVINITTDGAPNVPADGKGAAEASVTAAAAAGIDEVDVEAVGISQLNIDWLALDLVYPDGPGGITGAIIPPESYPPRPPARGFVRVCADFNEYVEAIGEKFEAILEGRLTLAPPTATNPINTEHCVTAHLEDGSNNPVPGVDVTFTVTGTHPQVGVVPTDPNGDAVFCYTGTNVGSDMIVATCDDPENAGLTLTSNEVSKDWTDIPPPPQVPGITGWGIIIATVAMAVLIPVTLRRRVFSRSR